MKNIIIAGLCFILGFTACTDKTLDPLQFDQVKSGNMIALRGTAVDNLNNRKFNGAIDSFSISKPTNEKFEFDAEFLSSNPDNLKTIEVFAKSDKVTTRKKVATVDGGALSTKSGKGNPLGPVAIPLSTILTALGQKVTDFAKGDYITIECDLTLKDGGTVPANAIVHAQLTQSGIFYPAHSLFYLAGQ
jgi:hypothetical protein